MTQVQEKVALVTGGAAGLGAAIIRRLASEGAKVTLTDIQASAGQALANELACNFIHQDVIDETQWKTIIAQVEKHYGALHILVNNAGIEGPFDIANPGTTRLPEWQAIHRVNVEGVFLGCRAARAFSALGRNYPLFVQAELAQGCESTADRILSARWLRAR